MLLLFAALGVGGRAAAESAPHEVIATTAEAFATVVRNQREELETDLRDDFALVDEFLLPSFDLQSSCRLVLREHWAAATPGQRQRFVEALYRFLLVSYGDALLEFRHDTIRVLAGQAEPVGQSTRVRTEIRLTGGSVFDVDFYMRLDDRGWRIVDVIAEGISYVRTYRTDFSLEIRADGLESLIARLENTAAERH
jgi:phospholipid transport system substrate-binding protein